MKDTHNSTKRNEAARAKIKQEHLEAMSNAERLAALKWPPRVLKAATQARLSRRFGQGL